MVAVLGDAASMDIPTFSPRVRIERVRIVAESGWLIIILSPGTVYRRVTINAEKAKITFSSRYLWFIRRRRVIKFEFVKAITYGYSSLTPDSMYSLAYDTRDSFRVGLRLIDETEVRMFSFVGDGEFVNDSGGPDWLDVFERVFDHVGDQQRESRSLVEGLARMLGTTIVLPRD
jgi:hypothetical protein